MTDFSAPLEDLKFALRHIAEYEKLAKFPGYEDATADITHAILEEAGKFAEQVFAPLNQSGDKQGCRIENGVVYTPDGFKSAFKNMSDGGWHGIAAPIEFGGQGLPQTLAIAVSEIWTSANMAFTLIPQLMQSATELIHQHASEAQKQKYLPNIIAGKWATTMNLTEPQAGSDLNLIRTEAIREDDHYLVTGQKIFITGGDHDLTENILHLVLARTPDAPPGLKGLSLFLVPKFMINEDNSLGPQNDLKCISLEKKLGIHATPTCVMSYGDNGGAIGYLIGEENQGLNGMFTMMNLTRLLVGLQGPAIGERAYQQARNYSSDRIQGSDASETPVTINHHPDVKRMLLDMKAKTQACRYISIYTASCLDAAKCAPTEEERALYFSRTELLTPVAKAWTTNMGIDIANTGIQIHGGTGYIEETGATQYLRDIRIASIYEGTNGIQAKDLIGRKIVKDKGKSIYYLTNEISVLSEEINILNKYDMPLIFERLNDSTAALSDVTNWALSSANEDFDLVLAGASVFLELFGNTLAGWLLIKGALAAAKVKNQSTENTDFLDNQILIAQHFATQVLSHSSALASSITDGAKLINKFAPDAR